jgi:hypothetical protein
MLLGLILEENIFCETNFGPFNLHIVQAVVLLKIIRLIFSKIVQYERTVHRKDLHWCPSYLHGLHSKIAKSSIFVTFTSRVPQANYVFESIEVENSFIWSNFCTIPQRNFTQKPLSFEKIYYSNLHFYLEACNSQSISCVSLKRTQSITFHTKKKSSLCSPVPTDS